MITKFVNNFHYLLLIFIIMCILRYFYLRKKQKISRFLTYSLIFIILGNIFLIRMMESVNQTTLMLLFPIFLLILAIILSSAGLIHSYKKKLKGIDLLYIILALSIGAIFMLSGGMIF